MKKALFNMATFVFLINFGYGQDYVQFPLPNAEWIFGVYDYSCGPPTYFCGYYYVKVEGDTLIGDFNYKKVLETGTNGLDYSYKAAIRQDTLTGKVYVNMPQCEGIDTLLYDFNLQQGDTLFQCSEILGGSPEEFFVNYVDSILINGELYKQLHLDMGENVKLIEGIGSTGGLLGPWNGWIGGNYYLHCFLIDGIPVYPDTSCILTNVNTIMIQPEMNVSIYPNPVSGDIVTFEFENTQYHSKMELKCYDLLGELVHSEKVYQQQGMSRVSTSGWPPGMYMAVIYSNGGAVGKCKFVVRE